MAVSYNIDREMANFGLGQKATQSPSLFRKFINYGTRAAKIIGSVMEGPTGMITAATEVGEMIKDKLDDKL